MRRTTPTTKPTTPTTNVYEWLELDRVVSSELRVRGWKKEPHESLEASKGAHAAVEVAFIAEGVVKYTIGAREITVAASHVMVVPRDVEHKTTFLTPMRGVALWLGADLVAQIADVMGPDVSARVLTPGVLAAKNDRIAQLSRVLVDEVREAGAGHTRAAEALTESIVIEMLRHARHEVAENGNARDPRVQAAISCIRESLAEPLSVDDLAKAAKMSRFHFSRLFRDAVGEAPYQFLLRARIAHAQELLRGGHHSVTEAALASGFSDFSRFASTFRKHTGKLPTELLHRARSA